MSSVNVILCYYFSSEVVLQQMAKNDPTEKQIGTAYCKERFKLKIIFTSIQICFHLDYLLFYFLFTFYQVLSCMYVCMYVYIYIYIYIYVYTYCKLGSNPG